MRTSAHFNAKNLGFFEIYNVFIVYPVRTFFGQGRVGQFCAILYGCLLWAATFDMELAARRYSHLVNISSIGVGFSKNPKTM